jgi:hypothetical protein
MKSIQIKFVIIMIIVINAVLCAPPQEENRLTPVESAASGIKVTLDERVNWGGIFEGAAQVFNGAKKIYHSVQEDDPSFSGANFSN